MIMTGEVYRSRLDPSRIAVVEGYGWGGVLYRVTVNSEHEHCSLDEADFLRRYSRIQLMR